MATTTMTEEQVPTVMRYLQAGLIGGVISAVLNLLLYFGGKAMGVPYEVVTPPTNQPMALPMEAIIMFSLLPGVGAGLLAWLLHRFAPRGKMVFLVIALLFLLVSFVPTLSLPDPVTIGTKIGLSLMHVVAGGVIIYMLNRVKA